LAAQISACVGGLFFGLIVVNIKLSNLYILSMRGPQRRKSDVLPDGNSLIGSTGVGPLFESHIRTPPVFRLQQGESVYDQVVARLKDRGLFKKRLFYREIRRKDIPRVLANGTDVDSEMDALISPFEKATMRQCGLSPEDDIKSVIRVQALSELSLIPLRSNVVVVYDRDQLDILYEQETYFCRFIKPENKVDAVVAVFSGD